jgi:hypothetical protein
MESSSDDSFDLAEIIKFKEPTKAALADHNQEPIDTDRVFFTPEDGKRRLIVVLDNAGLEITKTKHDF